MPGSAAPASFEEALRGQFEKLTKDALPGLAVLMARDGDSVFAQLTGQPGLPIFAKSAKDFEWRVAAAKVSFIKDADGSVTKASRTQNGRTFESPKIK